MSKTVFIECGVIESENEAGFYFGLKGLSPLYKTGPFTSHLAVPFLSNELELIKSQFDPKTNFVINRKDLKL